jgi:hypothetical protein
MDGGVAEQPESRREQAFPATRAEADAATLESDPYFADALSHLREAITEVAQTRWAARGPHAVAAAIRAWLRSRHAWMPRS